MIRGLLSSLVALSLAVIVLGWTFGTIIPPGSMGIRQISFGPFRGLTPEGLPPGYHWSIPVYSKIHIIPQTLQILNLDEAAARSGMRQGSVEVQTTDGSSVDVDLSILSRFLPAAVKGENGVMGGGPVDLIQKLGPTSASWIDTVGRVAVDEVRRALGKLSTSQFYNPHAREQQMHEAYSRINTRLNEFGIRVEAALVRRYLYREERIDKAIFDKNLQDQEERLNQAASKLSEAKAASEQVSAEMDAKIKTLTVEGENRARVIQSEGALYETERKAKADLLVAQATAEIESQKATLLAKTAGAEAFVARELAPLLSSLKGGVVSDINPYDMEEWTKKLGVGGNQ